MPFSEHVLLQALDSLRVLNSAGTFAELTAVVSEQAELIGVKYLRFAEADAAPAPLKALTETTPALLGLVAMQARHARFDDVVRDLMAPGLAITSNNALTDAALAAPYEAIVGDHREIGGATFYAATPIYSGERIGGYAAYFFERAPENIVGFVRLATILAQAGYDQMRQLAARLAPAASPLSRRQAETLALVAEGKSDWDISVLLGVHQTTVHDHVESAKRRLGVKTRVQAVLLAHKNGWISV